PRRALARFFGALASGPLFAPALDEAPRRALGRFSVGAGSLAGGGVVGLRRLPRAAGRFFFASSFMELTRTPPASASLPAGGARPRSRARPRGSRTPGRNRASAPPRFRRPRRGSAGRGRSAAGPR